MFLALQHCVISFTESCCTRPMLLEYTNFSQLTVKSLLNLSFSPASPPDFTPPVRLLQFLRPSDCVIPKLCHVKNKFECENFVFFFSYINNYEIPFDNPALYNEFLLLILLHGLRGFTLFKRQISHISLCLWTCPTGWLLSFRSKQACQSIPKQV